MSQSNDFDPALHDASTEQDSETPKPAGRDAPDIDTSKPAGREDLDIDTSKPAGRLERP